MRHVGTVPRIRAPVADMGASEVLVETHEGALAELLGSPWFVAGLAFLLGLGAGWIIWARPWGGDHASGEGNGSNGVLNGIIPAEATAEDKLALIAAEILKARSEMDLADETDAAMGADLDDLDQAIKRANGRLKLILKSVERGQDSE